MSFMKIEGDTAVLVSKGNFRVADLYEFHGQLFAKIGSVFVRLNADGSTSNPAQRIDTVHIEQDLYKDRFGRLCTQPAPDRKQIRLAEDAQGKMLVLEAPDGNQKTLSKG
jgi:hypothetical protein